MKKCKDCEKYGNCEVQWLYKALEADDPVAEVKTKLLTSDELLQGILQVGQLEMILPSPFLVDMMLTMVVDLAHIIIDELNTEEVGAMAIRAINCVKRVNQLTSTYDPKFGEGKAMKEDLVKILLDYNMENQAAEGEQNGK